MSDTEAKPGLMHRAKKALFLTGTPILNRPVEAQPLLAALNEREFGNFFAFAKRYCGAQQKWVGRKYVWDFSGATHLDELQERLRATVMVRRLKRDVLKELPPKRRQIVPLAPNGAAGAVKREAAIWATHEEKLAELQAEADLAHAAGDAAAYEAAAKRLQLASRLAFTELSAARREVAVAKVPHVIEYLQGMFEEGVEKIIVFAHHHEVVAKLADAFAGECVVLTGETPMADRVAAVDDFQTKPGVKVFIGSITAAGVGLTLTAASDVVFAELDWVPANVSQAEDRAHRMGQLNTVFVRHLVVDGSLDARMAQVLVEKQEVADRALDASTEIEVPLPAPPRPSRYPKATDEERAAAKTALRLLDQMCDGVRTRDGAGFSALTRHVGHKLAGWPGPYTDGQVFLAKRICRTHRRQLPVEIAAALGVEKE